MLPRDSPLFLVHKQKKGDMLSACRPFRWVLSGFTTYLSSVIFLTSEKLPAVIR
jgi:hypothetical protein